MRNDNGADAVAADLVDDPKVAFDALTPDDAYGDPAPASAVLEAIRAVTREQISLAVTGDNKATIVVGRPNTNSDTTLLIGSGVYHGNIGIATFEFPLDVRRDGEESYDAPFSINDLKDLAECVRAMLRGEA